MKVKNNYNESITNLACSIQKYFNLQTKHNSIPYIDKLLEEKNPENVVLILLDGLGSRILDRTLKDDDFLRRYKQKEITTVFPATTTAATTSMRTGLNPVEHGYLGWNVYIEPINKIITLYQNTEKGKNEVDEDFLNIKDTYYKLKTIPEQINEQKIGIGIELFPFQETIYKDLDDMLEQIKIATTKPGKKYIYAYDPEPDGTMHHYGPDSKEAREEIAIRNEKIEKLCNELQDTIIFITADHGHKKVDSVLLKNYKDLLNTLKMTTSMEPRATSFHVQEDKHQEFEELFNKYFSKDFTLYDKEEVIKSNLFGTGKEHPLFRSSLGDYIAIAEYSNKALISEEDPILTSHHAGYSEDEIYIPLIIVDKTKVKQKKI